MWGDLFSALALVLVIEGFLPLINPEWFKRMCILASQIDSMALRYTGLVSMLAGVILLQLIR